MKVQITRLIEGVKAGYNKVIDTGAKGLETGEKVILTVGSVGIAIAAIAFLGPWVTGKLGELG